MHEIKKTQRCFNFSMETRADSDNKGVIEGRAIVYDSPTDLGFFTEVIEKDALKNTNMKDVRLLVNHDTSMIDRNSSFMFCYKILRCRSG